MASRRRGASSRPITRRRWAAVRDLIHMRGSVNYTRKVGKSPHIAAYSKYGPIVTAREFTRRVPINRKRERKSASADEGRLRYCTHKYEDLNKHVHHGQRKLLLTEVEFLVNEYHKYAGRKDVVVLYVGAACGTHINALVQMFPMFEYHLYDRTRFDRALYEHDNVRIFREYFTDERAREYSERNVIFISDIRSLEIRNKKECDDFDDEIVADDMEMQKNWYNIIAPLCSLLKFRLPWDKKNTMYLKGDLYYQVWQPRHSSESRLSPEAPFSECAYDNLEYDEKMHFFNRITRRQLYKNDAKCYGNCYDCFSEMYVLSRYIERFILPNESESRTAVDDEIAIKSEYLCALRYMIDDSLGRKLF